MKGLPQIIRNQQDKSITLSLPHPKCSIIWLHGLGGEAQNYVGFWRFRTSALHKGWRIKMIQAPERWVTIREQSCHSWYDVRSLNRFTQSPSRVFDVLQVKESFGRIDKYVKEELELWSRDKDQKEMPLSRRVYLGGMSQGGAMSLYYAHSCSHLLGGTIALSSYLLPFTPLTNKGKVPLLLVHGQKDGEILQREARNSYAGLYSSEENIEYVSVPKLGHSVCIEEIGMVSEWLQVTHSLHEINYN